MRGFPDLPPIWWLGSIAAIYLFKFLAPGLHPDIWWLDALSWLVLFAAACIIGWSAWYFFANRTPIEPHHTPKSLIISGPYRVSRNPIYLALVLLTLASAMGHSSLLGIVLAVGIVHVMTLEKSLMPWVISSQTIPILAIAPMVIVVLGAIGIKGLVPKAIISTYLCFFPVTISMVKGLRSPQVIQLDLMRTYNASKWQTFWQLRLPSAMPYLFASLKVAIAISLVGAIIGELPTGAQAGLGARLLAGSYYGQTIQIWSALFTAAFLAAMMVVIVGWCERRVLVRMGVSA